MDLTTGYDGSSYQQHIFAFILRIKLEVFRENEINSLKIILGRVLKPLRMNMHCIGRSNWTGQMWFIQSMRARTESMENVHDLIHYQVIVATGSHKLVTPKTLIMR
jgi:hypothetical protein